jgi:hypothetical protein
MTIPEAQLDTWSNQGPTGQFTSTYQTLKAVLHDQNSPYGQRSFETFLQGSYGNDTNIYADSDVDVVIRSKNVYYSDVDGLSPEDKEIFQKDFSPATYDLADFKRDVADWLRRKYGSAVKEGSKAISIARSGSRRDADVIVAAEFRRYRKFRSAFNQEFEEGICFFRSDGTLIKNFPKQHSANCTAKHQGTNQWFKRTARVYKNLRNRMVEKRIIEDGLAPSYFIEGLLYNAPAHRFGGSNTANFKDTLTWLVEADRSKFVCANELFYLLHDYSPVTWRADKCTQFLNAAVGFWNSGG